MLATYRMLFNDFAYTKLTLIVVMASFSACDRLSKQSEIHFFFLVAVLELIYVNFVQWATDNNILVMKRYKGVMFPTENDCIMNMFHRRPGFYMLVDAFLILCCLCNV